MIHSICPICSGKLSEILPGTEDRTVNHKIYLCDNDVDHKFWVSEYESDCLRWNPAVNFEDNIYFRKFKNSNREIVKSLALEELTKYINSEKHRLSVIDAEDDTEFFGRRDIENTYKNTPEYTEIHDEKVHENLLGIIQSLNNTIKALITEYHTLEKFTDELQEKHDKLLKNPNVTPSGIILKI